MSLVISCLSRALCAATGFAFLAGGLSAQTTPLPQSRVLTLTSNPLLPSYGISFSGYPFVSFTQQSNGAANQPSNSLPGTITLIINPNGLAPGIYTNLVTFSGMAGLNSGSITYLVTLTVQENGANARDYRPNGGLVLLDRNGDGS